MNEKIVLETTKKAIKNLQNKDPYIVIATVRAISMFSQKMN